MDWIDYSQNRRIRELEEGVSTAQSMLYSERRRMRSELSQLRGGLEQRLNRVSATLDAFIELSDVRATLAVFAPNALARHRTLSMIDGEVPATLELEDVPDYWLVPAARGLHALLTGSPDTARLRFREAAERDPERAGAFAVLATALTSAEYARALGTTEELLPHLPAPDERMTRGRRALWMLTADGSLGEDAREHLLLSTLRHWSRLETTLPSIDLSGPARTARSTSSRERGGVNAQGEEAIENRARAVERLAALRENIARITALGSEDTRVEGLAPDQTSAVFLSEALISLVSEGTAEEAPLIARANELRAVIENGGGGRSLGWDDEVGTVASLLEEDLRREGVPPHRSTFALVLQRPAVMRAVEELVEQARTPIPEDTFVTLHGLRVTVGGHGPSSEELRKARTRLADRHRPEGKGRTYLWGFAALAALLAVLGLVAQSGFAWFLCLASAIAAGGAYVFDSKERGQAREASEYAFDRLKKEADQAGDRWRKRREAAEEHPATAQRSANEISGLLDPR
ncbi:hypothetical protein [Nocardiopsis lambiniae]|uniref:Uncharacterized protein n=1 Tax=Nocardiopsis lambiniae TaxID=3075539 RepID=A0ABU2MAR6_9ACTN|nr:hypothetical protein [Nocardiopsis sp. DSM 44743]MDT0329336.1 hypothetical protein [Nocardiopsis sp. DSM 44743]